QLQLGAICRRYHRADDGPLPESAGGDRSRTGAARFGVAAEPRRGTAAVGAGMERYGARLSARALPASVIRAAGGAHARSRGGEFRSRPTQLRRVECAREPVSALPAWE